MHAVKGTRPEPGVSPRALMDRMTVAHMSRLGLQFWRGTQSGIHLAWPSSAVYGKRRCLCLLAINELGDSTTHMIRPSVTPRVQVASS